MLANDCDRGIKYKSIVLIELTKHAAKDIEDNIGAHLKMVLRQAQDDLWSLKPIS